MAIRSSWGGRHEKLFGELKDMRKAAAATLLHDPAIAIGFSQKLDDRVRVWIVGSTDSVPATGRATRCSSTTHRRSTWARSAATGTTCRRSTHRQWSTAFSHGASRTVCYAPEAGGCGVGNGVAKV